MKAARIPGGGLLGTTLSLGTIEHGAAWPAMTGMTADNMVVGGVALGTMIEVSTMGAAPSSPCAEHVWILGEFGPDERLLGLLPGAVTRP